MNKNKKESFYGTVRKIKPDSREIKRGSKLIYNGNIITVDDSFRIGFGKPVLDNLNHLFILEIIGTEIPLNDQTLQPFIALKKFPLHIDSWDYAIQHNLIDKNIAVSFEVLDGETVFRPTTYDQPDREHYVKFDQPQAKIIEYNEALFSENNVVNMVYDLVRSTATLKEIKSIEDVRKYVLNNTKQYKK